MFHFVTHPVRSANSAISLYFLFKSGISFNSDVLLPSGSAPEPYLITK